MLAVQRSFPVGVCHSFMVPCPMLTMFPDPCLEAHVEPPPVPAIPKYVLIDSLMADGEEPFFSKKIGCMFWTLFALQQRSDERSLLFAKTSSLWTAMLARHCIPVRNQSTFAPVKSWMIPFCFPIDCARQALEDFGDCRLADSSFLTKGNNVPFALGELVVAPFGPSSFRNWDPKTATALPFF